MRGRHPAPESFSNWDAVLRRTTVQLPFDAATNPEPRFRLWVQVAPTAGTTPADAATSAPPSESPEWCRQKRRESQNRQWHELRFSGFQFLYCTVSAQATTDLRHV